MTTIISAACLAITLLFCPAVSPQAGPGSQPARDGPAGAVSCLLLLEADAFLCSPCLSRTLGFIQGFHSDLGRAGLWAVVLYDKPKANVDETLYRRMIGRRAESVFKANRIHCPVVIDEAAKWRGFSVSGAGLVVFDSGTRSVRTLALPLSPDALKIIQRIINQGGTHESILDFP